MMRLLLLLCLVLCQAAAHAAGGLDEAQMRAAFVHRFAQYTQWPPPPLREFTYCTAGIEGDGEAWRQLPSRPMGGLPIQLVNLDSPQQVAQCQLLVLGHSDRAELRRWMHAIGDLPVLVVGASPEAYRAGASIVLMLEPQGLAFRINNTEARRRGLVLSSQMLKLAREVR
ncbi:YfiR family protein [Paucibacter soli]|uniref:YfiR family protein n=1 Tax=Paucibacter soli TaxID=3133433 RepID=UPI0030A13D9B